MAPKIILLYCLLLPLSLSATEQDPCIIIYDDFSRLPIAVYCPDQDQIMFLEVEEETQIFEQEILEDDDSPLQGVPTELGDEETITDEEGNWIVR